MLVLCDTIIVYQLLSNKSLTQETVHKSTQSTFSIFENTTPDIFNSDESDSVSYQVLLKGIRRNRNEYSIFS